MRLKSFVAGLVVGLLIALWAHLATLRGRVESRAATTARAHRRGREWERERPNRDVTIHPAARPGTGEIGLGSGDQPPSPGAATADHIQRSEWDPHRQSNRRIRIRARERR